MQRVYDLLLKYMKCFSKYFIVLVLFSCEQEKETSFTVCDCVGKSVENIKGEGGDVALSVDGFKIISVEHGYLTPCQELSEEFKKDGQLVQFSGKIIPTCKKEHSGYAIWSYYLEITEIKKIDTLYKSGNLIIEIIQTENFGKQEGFGNIVHDIKKDFKIVQDEIPAQLVVEPFKTKADAMKVAYLVAYKLENFDDFPSVYLGDLHFLKILGM